MVWKKYNASLNHQKNQSYLPEGESNGEDMKGESMMKTVIPLIPKKQDHNSENADLLKKEECIALNSDNATPGAPQLRNGSSRRNTMSTSCFAIMCVTTLICILMTVIAAYMTADDAPICPRGKHINVDHVIQNHKSFEALKVSHNGTDEVTSIRISTDHHDMNHTGNYNNNDKNHHNNKNKTTIKTNKPKLNPTCTDIEDDKKLDCYPDSPATEQQCLARGCCWKVVGKQANLNEKDHPPLNTPYCYFPINYQGYLVTSLQRTQSGIQATLFRNEASGFPNDITEAQVVISYMDDSTVRIKIYDPNSSRYEVPYPWLPEIKPRGTDVLNQKYDIQFYIDGNLKVQRRDTGLTLFSTNLSLLIFADQFLQLSTYLPSKYIYGLGEHMDGLPRNVNWSRITLFNRDQEPVPDINLYGSHPFYLVMEEDGNSHGVFLFNSNAMDVILQPAPAITFRPIGGIFDFLIFLGPKPGDVISQYINMIGVPFLPPYWSLGFHLCRFGYNSVNGTRTVWERTRNANIPFDVQWNDIDYMERHNDFTIDQVAFKNFSGFVEEVHNAGMHYVLMFDPGISASEAPGTYPPYDDGVEMDIFVKNSSGQIFIGKVWNRGNTVFPDFLNPHAADYWVKQFQAFHKQVPFDGAWIDMNEPSNFYDGQIDGCPSNSSLENPPYVPGTPPLYHKTLCMTAQHYNAIHYNVHNIYGFMEAIATNIALRFVLRTRPFIISRATFPGQGRFSGHWDGDVISDWRSLRWTIPSILNFNMFGMPMVGADICGFNGNTTVELCARWSSLGAFYPFSRNHNEDSTIDQDPVALGPAVVSSAKKALTIRYYLLPYLYTLFYKSTVTGETVARPLFFEFPHDKNTYTIDTQFLWGSAFMIIPTLYEGATNVTAYFPKGIWYDYYTREARQSNGQTVTLDSPIDHINLAIRGGYILPAQEPGMTTTESRNNSFHLLVALDASGRADGFLYWDDGESLEPQMTGQFNYISFGVMNHSLYSVCLECGYKSRMHLDKIIVMGLSSKPASVTANGKAAQFTYNEQTKVMEIDKLNLNLTEDILVTWK